MQQTTVDGYSLADGTRSSKQGEYIYFYIFSSRYRGEPQDNYTRYRSPGVLDFADELATTKGDCIEQQAKQESRPGRVVGRQLYSAGRTGYERFVCVLYPLQYFLSAFFPCFFIMPCTRDETKKCYRR